MPLAKDELEWDCGNMEPTIVAVKGGFHAKGLGTGREIVAFGATRTAAEKDLTAAQERSQRLQRLADKRKEAGSYLAAR